MPKKKRRKKGEATSQILEILQEKDNLRAKEISKKIKEKHQSINDRVLHYNLNNLLEKNKISKRNQKYSLTDSYREELLKDSIEKIVEKSQPWSIGNHRSSPIFSFGHQSEKVKRSIFPGGIASEKIEEALEVKTQSIIRDLGGLDRKNLEFGLRALAIGASKNRLGGEWKGPRSGIIEEIGKMHGSNDEFQKKLIIEFIANPDWKYSLSSSFLEGLEEAFKDSDLNGNGKRALGVELNNFPLNPKLARIFSRAMIGVFILGIDSPGVAFGDEIRNFFDMGMLSERFGLKKEKERFVETLREEFFNQVKSLLTKKSKESLKGMKCSSPVSNMVVQDIISKVELDYQENKSWLSRNLESFESLVQDLNNTSFGILAALNYPELENYPKNFEISWAPEDLKMDLEELIKEKPFGEEPIKEEGEKLNDRLRVLIDEIDNILYRIEHDLEPKEVDTADKIKAFKWALGSKTNESGVRTPKYLYKNFEEAKKKEFWKDLKIKAEKALKNN